MAKPTPSQEKQVTAWFMDKFWPNYPTKYCGRGKGSRAISCKLMIAINPDELEQEIILGNLKAQVRAHSQKPEQMRSFWKIGETYVRNQLWNDEIESAMEVKEKQILKTCSRQGCNDSVHGSGFTECSLHMPSLNDIRYTKLVEAKKQIDEALERNQPGFADRCMAYAEEQGFIFTGKKKEKKRWQKLDTAPRDGTAIDLWDIGGFKVDSVKWDMETGLWSTLQDDSRYGYWMEAQ